jgi:hypothetical protein
LDAGFPGPEFERDVLAALGKRFSPYSPLSAQTLVDLLNVPLEKCLICR